MSRDFFDIAEDPSVMHSKAGTGNSLTLHSKSDNTASTEPEYNALNLFWEGDYTAKVKRQRSAVRTSLRRSGINGPVQEGKADCIKQLWGDTEWICKEENQSKAAKDTCLMCLPQRDNAMVSNHSAKVDNREGIAWGSFVVC